MKAYTDLEQSKKLADILPIESADMFYRNNGIDVKLMWEHNAQKVTSPCWSLAALLDYLLVNQGVIVKSLYKQWEVDCIVHVEYSKELVDACVEMIIELHEQKLL